MVTRCDNNVTSVSKTRNTAHCKKNNDNETQIPMAADRIELKLVSDAQTSKRCMVLNQLQV
jgi:hypothetical protein